MTAPRRRWSYGLRTMLAAVTILAALISYAHRLWVSLEKEYRMRELRKAIKEWAEKSGQRELRDGGRVGQPLE